MPSINLADAVIAWSPRDLSPRPEIEFAPQGSVVVFHGPDDRGAFRRYPCWRGAGDEDWAAGDDAFRLQLLADVIHGMINVDEIAPAHISEALRVIEGIERLRFYRGRSSRELWLLERPHPLAPGEPSDEEVRAMSAREWFEFMLVQVEREWPTEP